jgi:GTPase SAR1 family protein
MLVYDVTNNESFTNLPRWHADYLRYAKRHVPLLIFGNKLDLVTETRPRVVEIDEASLLAYNIGSQYHEGSALRGVADVELAMASLIERVVCSDSCYSSSSSPESEPGGTSSGRASPDYQLPATQSLDDITKFTRRPRPRLHKKTSCTMS